MAIVFCCAWAPRARTAVTMPASAAANPRFILSSVSSLDVFIRLLCRRRRSILLTADPLPYEQQGAERQPERRRMRNVEPGHAFKHGFEEARENKQKPGYQEQH